MFERLKFFIVILFLIIIVFNISYSSAFDIIDGTVNSVYDVTDSLIGIFGLRDFTIIPSVSVIDDVNNPSSDSLGYYTFQGDQLSVSWYLLNNRLFVPYGFNNIEYIYPNTYRITLHVLFSEDKTYNDCIRFTVDGVDFLWCQSGFDTTTKNYPLIDLYSPLFYCSFHDYNSPVFFKYFRMSGLRQNNELVKDFVQNTLID